VHEEELEIDHARLGPARVGGSTAVSSREETTFEEDSQAGLKTAGGSDEAASREMRMKMMARSLRNMGAAPSGAHAAIEGAVAEPQAAGAAAIDTSQLSADDKLFVEEVRVRVKRAPLQSAYVRLGLQPGATGEQIKSAYLQLAKRFHPDRASAPGMGPLLPDLQALFRLLKEAYEALGTPQARDKYGQQLKSGGAPSRKEDSATVLKMGEVLLKKRDFEGALHKLRHAVDLDPSGDALAALAWGLVSDPKATPQTREEAAALIQRALRAQGISARTYYVAGVLWRTKDPDSAVDAFRKALELDPHHSDASLELRLIEQRRGKQQKSGGGVLSGLLFGKRKS
jgi:curved DNA-binding protein CbpA